MKVRLEARSGLGVIVIDHPPVNAISADVVAQLGQALDAWEARTELAALVIACDGRTFAAGGDIAGFDRPDFSPAPFNGILARIEAQARPVVAALHGSVLGGGFELALACHGRVAADGTRFGFPEVQLGLLPGSLGTQRLPRLVGPELALDLISSGRTLGSAAALAAGIVDRVVPDALAGAIALGEEWVRTHCSLRRLSVVRIAPDEKLSRRLEAAAAEACDRQPSNPAAVAIVRAVQASLLPFAEGEAIEASLFEALRTSPQSQSLRHLFFARRSTWKIPGLSRDIRHRELHSIGVLGAGTMGRGIAMNFLNAGLPTRLVDASQAALDTAVSIIRSLYEASAAKGRISGTEVAARMALLHTDLGDAALADCDLVVEAVYEDFALKQRVCERLGALCRPDAIIATNTSTLDVDRLAAATGRPRDVVGMHFFSPAHVMKLLEVVRGRETAHDVLATVMALARRIGKTAVVSGVCYGFIGNRMAEVYMREAEFLLMEGASPAQVDAAVEALGMAMGPCRMLDLAGVDVGARTVIEYAKSGGLPPDASYRALVRALYESGRHGQKTGAGYYRYEGRTALPDPETERISIELAARHGIARRPAIDEREIVERLLYPMINEGAKILEEGIACRGSDIDVVWTAGYGFPAQRGGPLFMADSIGLHEVAQRLQHYAKARGNPHGYWTTSPLLDKLSVEGRRISSCERPR
ncbi:enoyl-CoA hydratase [Variovorax sp. WS11]|uniref:3-hydroxyacyl-CoA dehydrogenase NAD-binding domain-containing protein n=1 Tax=Variovorax sp. WS11 TaxID=1105204 RepID=UPI000D0CAC30|nr:3-hydroxyacyl-CoA dehydrogenase NAD-binding domain-containing protein [Variovorax sp. WS11]NDZ17351.1 enoyl-CoA hydratase [Variovorax sp. WS11]PSL86109.1 enoyl-CoA hydratase [Variovorax sp. WS11]